MSILTTTQGNFAHIGSRHFAAGAAIGATIIASMAAPSLAVSNSTPGGERYDANPGRQQATEVGAQCGTGAGSGAFGFFGKDNNLAAGANGPATGAANSSICGNRP